MADVFNTSYRTKADVNTEEERLYYNIEEGAYVTTSAGVWTVWNGEWVKLYPQSGAGSGLGWTRYDDTVYIESNKLSLTDGAQVTLPNNGGNIVRSYSGIDYYDTSTQKVLGDTLNDVYLMTVVFKASAPNANQTFLRLQLEGGNGTPYERVGVDVNFAKGNDVMHEFHQVFQYYTDSAFISSGATWKLTSTGGTAQVWDIIFFISKVQSYA
jgi:hypothetical protein